MNLIHLMKQTSFKLETFELATSEVIVSLSQFNKISYLCLSYCCHFLNQPFTL